MVTRADPPDVAALDTPSTPLSAWTVAAATPDPELPQLTIEDLGILRSLIHHGGRLVATITPTYSGCPALGEIRADLAARLRSAGHGDVEIRTQLAPAWTSDWITTAGREKLTAAGIAAPQPATRRAGPIPLRLGAPPPAAACPQCGSTDTQRIAAFSGTACKALYRCRACDEPFESMKAI